MKTWKKILLEAGIFTAVFALGAGTGFVSCYRKAEVKIPTIKNEATEGTPTQREETPTDKYLNNLVSTKALAGDIHLTISTASEQTEEQPAEEEIPSRVRRGLEDLNLGDINLDITNVQLSIADLENIKLSADLNVKMTNLDLDLSLGYFDNTIFLDYADTHFFLKTDDITDFMDMLPSFGINLDSSSTSFNLDNLDIDSLTGALANMEEFIEGEEHYFMFNFNEDIAIKLLSDEEYHLVGVELEDCKIKGLTINATSNLHSLSEDIEDLVAPNLVEGAPEYREFKPAFTLVNDVMDIVNSKQARVGIDLDINRLGEGEEPSYEDFISVNGNIDFDINELKVLADIALDYKDSSFALKAGYQDETVFAAYKNLKLSITNQSILSLAEYICEKLNNQTLEEALNNLGNVSSEIDLDLDTILTYVNNIPNFIDNFSLTNDSLSLTIVSEYLDLPVSNFDIAINFDDESLKSLSVTGLCYGAYQINVTLGVSAYEEVVINANEYVALDPAISLVSSVEKLIKQNQFGASFTVTTDDGDDTNQDLTASGLFHFSLREKTDAEIETQLIPSDRTFDYGAGELTINDKDGYPHNIRVDAQPYTAEKNGKVLLSYGGTSDHRTNARIDYKTFDEIVEKIKSVTETSDSNISQLISSLMSSAESSPISTVLSASSVDDYVKLLDNDIINSLNITDTEVALCINGDFLGFGETDLNLTLRYNAEALEGLDITGLVLGGQTINISLNLLDFSQEVYESYSLTEDSSYIDLSTISDFASQTLNTVENNYFHIRGSIGLEFDSGFLDTLAGLFVNKTMTADIQMINTKSHFSFVLHLIDIPTAIIVSDGFHTGMSREAWVMFDNEKDVDGDGLFYVHRHDAWNGLWGLGAGTNDVYAKYDLEGFKSNLMTIFMSDVLGLGSSIMDSVSNVKSTGGQIEYENIIQDYKYTESFALENDFYKNGTSTNVNKYYFAINIGELAQSDALKTLSVTAYALNDMLAGLSATLSLKAGIDMTVNADLFFQDDTSATITDQVLMHGSQTMADYMTAHAGDPLNARA